MSSGNGESQDGFMDRMAKKLFASPDSPFTAFADNQRMERLEKCRELQRILVACQSAQNAALNENKDASSEKIVDFPQSRSAVRIARFFKWGSADTGEQPNDAQQQSEDGPSVLSEAASSFYEGSDNNNSDAQRIKKSVPKRSRYSKDCAIETHELWACRALALGCGNHLSDLRHCLNDDNQLVVQDSGSEVQYHQEAKKTCRDVQVEMATCVNKRALELDQRMKAAAKKR